MMLAVQPVKKVVLNAVLVMLGFSSLQVLASTCPDPNLSSLSRGVVPEPWIVSPFSDNKPHGEPSARFVRANILVAGLGRGVVCHYQISKGYYSIWWQTSVKRPALTEVHWRDSLGGYECTSGVSDCVFYP